MADQNSQPFASPSTPSTTQISMREAAFLASSRRLAAQPQTVLRVAKRPQRNPLAARPFQFKRGKVLKAPHSQHQQSSLKVRRKDRMTKSWGCKPTTAYGGGDGGSDRRNGGRGTRRSTLALEDPKETVNVDSYEGPSRVVLEEVAAEKQSEVVEEKKKKKKSKGKKIGEGEPSHHRKAEKKNKEKENEEDEEAKLRKRKERGERKERRREERRLRKEEEKKKRAASLEMDGASTSVRKDRGNQHNLGSQCNLKQRNWLQLTKENKEMLPT
ncbi:nucleolar protein 58-like [Benincasa hispida]|uniref:nucleolar protein 58-like n=1 Tax=Benincasa hispida TaxID=102211 RepID=UPI001900B190|nr:nucleolar protein 58-like [Benincasa hispida]